MISDVPRALSTCDTGLGGGRAARSYFVGPDTDDHTTIDRAAKRRVGKRACHIVGQKKRRVCTCWSSMLAFCLGTGTSTSTAWSCSLQLEVCLALLTALEMCHRDSGIDHDGATVFLTDPSSRHKRISPLIQKSACQSSFLLRSVTCNVCMLKQLCLHTRGQRDREYYCCLWLL